MDVYAFVSVLIITPTIVFSFLVKKKKEEEEEERESTHLKDTIPREHSLFLRLSPVWQGYCFPFSFFTLYLLSYGKKKLNCSFIF